MSTDTHNTSVTLDRTTTRRSFLKMFTAGAAASALLATSRVAEASRALPNRETGTAPVLVGTSSFRGPATPRRRFERRLPE